jgi:hypothetical protein
MTVEPLEPIPAVSNKALTLTVGKRGRRRPFFGLDLSHWQPESPCFRCGGRRGSSALSKDFL